MRLRFWLLLFALAAPFAISARPTASAKFDSGDSTAGDPPRAKLPTSPQFLGAGSCSASACHNANFVQGFTASEYTTWITRDPHARAYEVLFDERSKKMQKALERTTLPHEDPRCLRCHVSPHFQDQPMSADAAYFKTDGVSCESCHGPASEWIKLHHLPAWRGKSNDEKKRFGMVDTRSIVGRAELCVQCHVGGPGRDVDHDLIAAGHPRLFFEFSAFHESWPRHGQEAKAFGRVAGATQAQAWAVGQLVTARASLELVAERSGNAENPWPEFAEFDCTSCHHNLQAEGSYKKLGSGTRRPGTFPWGHQVLLAPLAAGIAPAPMDLRDPIQSLRKLVESGKAPRQTIAADARKAAKRLAEMLDAIERAGPHGKVNAADLARRLADWAPGSQDERTQVHLALVALHQSGLPSTAKGSTAEPPPAFDPRAIRARLNVLQKGR